MAERITINSLTVRFETTRSGSVQVRFLVRFSNGATLERQTTLDTPQITLDFKGSANDAEPTKAAHTLH